MLPSVNKNFKIESNPMPKPPYLYLSRSAFLGSFVEPNKQLFNVKLFKFLNHGLSIKEIYRFITFLGIEKLLFIMQCPLKFMAGIT